MTARVDLSWTRRGPLSAVAHHGDVTFWLDQITLPGVDRSAPARVLFQLSVAPFFGQPRRYLCARPDVVEVMASASEWAATLAMHEMAA